MTITTYATVSDLEARWRTLTESEEARAGVLLTSASAYLTTEAERCGVAIDSTDEVQAENLKGVCCDMVKRVMASGVDGDYTQTSMTAGAYSQSWTLANPSGDMYLSASERTLLGFPRRVQAFGTIPPLIGDPPEVQP